MLLITGFLMLTSAPPSNDAVATSEKLNKLLATTPQDCTHFIQGAQQADQPIVEYTPDQVLERFLHYYFLPWDNPFLAFRLEELREREGEKVQSYLKNPGWSFNQYPISTDFIAHLSSNMDWDSFPNCQQPAIAVRGTDLRIMPTADPSFTNLSDADQGYPFDNWQESFLSPNMPVCILQCSQDGAWYFVVTGEYTYGWAKREDIAYVTPAFITQWRTGQYVTPLRDGVPVVDHVEAPLARIGQLMPLAQEQLDKAKHQVLTVATDSAGNAEIKLGKVSQADAVKMPWLATPHHIATLANRLMGKPYGWGGMLGYRDCSALMQDLFMPFGIWLPRNTKDQHKVSTFVSLEGIKRDEKAKLITAQATPFLSMIWKRGHILLYIGTQESEVYVYNSIWGLHTNSATGEQGRAVLGRVVTMPLDLGKDYGNIKRTHLERAQGLIQLTDRLIHPHRQLALFQ